MTLSLYDCTIDGRKLSIAVIAIGNVAYSACLQTTGAILEFEPQTDV